MSEDDDCLEEQTLEESSDLSTLIKKCWRNQATNLDLSSASLIELPDSIGQLTQLQTLFLNNNQLTEIPDSISQLTQLTTLNLDENQ